MKKSIITLSFLLLAVGTMSQKPVVPHRHQVSAGFGVFFVGSGDMIGSNYRNEYQYQIHKRMAVAASLNFGQAGREVMGIGTKTYRRVKNVTTADVNLLFALLDSKTFRIKAGAGVSFKKQLDNDPFSLGFSITKYGSNPNFEMIDYSYQGNMRTFDVGFTVPVSIELHSNRLLYQVRASFHSFLDGEINTGLGFGIGYKF